MSTTPSTVPPSEALKAEADAFAEALDTTPPNALSACSGWTAHEVTAHLVAAGVEIALNLEAYGNGEPVPPTRGFEERERPYREMSEEALRSEFGRSTERMTEALDAVLMAEPDAVVPWTGRQMVVATFITHVRSELAIHRWDLIGDDDTSTKLLAQDELTVHAVEVLGPALDDQFQGISGRRPRGTASWAVRCGGCARSRQ
jgi:uncharacterized protein (TIGR03083 family)